MFRFGEVVGEERSWVSMFKRKREEQDRGFTATLRLPKYIPKDRLLGKVVFDYDLERIGQVIDWTYTPEGRISLVVSGKGMGKSLKGGDSVFIPFEYIERVGRFILLSESVDSLLPKNVIISEEERREKAVDALEEEFEKEDAREEEEKAPKSKGKAVRRRRKKKPKEELKAFNELEAELFANILEPPEPPKAKDEPPPSSEMV